MRHTLLIKCLSLLCCLSNIPLAVFAAEYAPYCNDRFGFCVSYPNHFARAPEPDNGDGQSFYDNDGFNMTASGSNNVFRYTLDEAISHQTQYFDAVTYQQKAGRWYVMSGYKGDEILYIKSFVGTESINTLHLQYPTMRKSSYDKIVTNIAKSFQAGSLDESH